MPDMQELESYTELYKMQADPHRTGFAEVEATRTIMEQSGLPNSDLSSIYIVSDTDGDGLLRPAEFVCAMALVSMRLRGKPLEENMPKRLMQQCEAAVSTLSPQATPAGSLREFARPRADGAFALSFEEVEAYKEFLAKLGLWGSGKPLAAADGVQELLEQSGLPP